MKPSSNQSLPFMRMSKDRDGSRKENTVFTNPVPSNILVRRQTVCFNPKSTSASLTGRRKTIYIDTPNLLTKKSRKGTALTSICPSSVVKTLPPLIIKNDIPKSIAHRLGSPPLRVKTAADYVSKTKDKVTSKLLAPKFKDSLIQVPHRENSSTSNRSLFSNQAKPPSQRSTSSTKRDNSPLQRDSSSHRRESSSHRRDSSSNRSASSKRHSTSSESSANRSATNHKSTKRRSSKDNGHRKYDEKRRRLVENKFENSIVKTAPDISVTETLMTLKKTSETLNNSPNLVKNLEDYKIRKQSNSTATKEPLANKMKPEDSLRPTDSKRIGNTVTKDQVQKRKDPSKDPLWNPKVTLHRLKFDPLKWRVKNTKEVIVSDDNYTVYCVDGKFKVKTKKDRQTNGSKKSQRSDSFSKANAGIISTHIETRNFSQQTERRAFVRDIGVQKFDEQLVQQARKHAESISLYNQSVREYDTAVREQQHKIDSLNQTVNEKENKIAERERMVAERDLQITEREQMIAERDLKIADRDVKIKEYEEIIKLQENNFQVMSLQMNSLKQSKENLSKLLTEQEAKLKDLTRKTSTPTEASTTTGPRLKIRVKNIDELRALPLTTDSTSSQPTNVTRNPTPPTPSFSEVPNIMRWTADTPLQNPSHTSVSTQPSSTQYAPYLQMVTQSGPYMYTHQHTTPATSATSTYDAQPTTSAANTHDAQSKIPATSTTTNSTPHQNLPRIVQRSVQERQILPRSSHQINSAGQNVSFDRDPGFAQNGSNQTRNVSQIRNRAKSCYYGSRPVLQPLQPYQPLQPHQALE